MTIRSSPPTVISLLIPVRKEFDPPQPWAPVSLRGKPGKSSNEKSTALIGYPLVLGVGSTLPVQVGSAGLPNVRRHASDTEIDVSFAKEAFHGPAQDLRQLRGAVGAYRVDVFSFFGPRQVLMLPESLEALPCLFCSCFVGQTLLLCNRPQRINRAKELSHYSDVFVMRIPWCQMG
jgi:hypothetical protein